VWLLLEYTFGQGMDVIERLKNIFFFTNGSL